MLCLFLKSRVLKMLVEKYSVKLDKAIILTHYRAQKKEIEKALGETSAFKNSVSTIVLSQGLCIQLNTLVVGLMKFVDLFKDCRGC